MKSSIVGVILGVVVFGGVFCGLSCIEKVPAGYRGIVYDPRGGVTGEVLDQGWHMMSPWKTVSDYSIGIEQSYLTSSDDGDSPHDDSFEVPSSDGKGLTVDLTFTYRYDAENISDIFKRFKGQSGKEIKSSFIKPNVISWTKEVTAKHPVTEILGEERANINIELAEYLKEKFAPYGIIIENASLINIEADPTTAEAIQKKINAQQEKELAKIQSDTAKINADKDKEVALIQAQKEREVEEINKEKAILTAEAEAESVRIKSEAEAEANKRIAESLTEEFVEYTKVNIWNGKLPQIQAGEGTSLILDVEQ